jgi:hypothetical protein
MLISNRYVRTVTSIFVLFICGQLFSSCDLFTEPEPFVNNQTHPLEIKPCTLSSYSVDQVVTGDITFFILDLNVSEIDHISLFIDSTFAGSVNISPYTFIVDTRRWPDGRHTLFFGMYKKEDSLGLRRLLNSPSQVYTTTLIFDNTPPIAPKDFSITTINDHVQLSWTPTNLTNFFSYIVRRNGNIIATLYSQNTSLYIDSAYTLADFDRVFYDIGASTNTSAAYTPGDTIRKGEALLLEPITAALDGFNDQVIFLTTKLVAVSTQTHNSLTQYSINGKGVLAKSLDGKEIFYWSTSYNKLYIFKTGTLELYEEYSLGWIGKVMFQLAIGLWDQVYISDNSGYLQIVTITNGLAISGPRAFFDGPARFLSISPDGTKILVADNKGVKSYLLTEEHATFALQSSITDSVGLFRADWNNSRIFITRQKIIVEEWNTQTLNSIGSFQTSSSLPSVTDITALTANSKYLFIAYTIQHNGGNASIVVEYDISTKQQTRSWSFSSIIQSLLVSENGRYLFACTSTDQWIVDVGDGL